MDRDLIAALGFGVMFALMALRVPIGVAMGITGVGGFALLSGTLPALNLLGNGRRYGVHLRTADMTLPWQAWRASFTAPPVWHTVQLPFTAFTPYRHVGTLEAAAVRRIGVLALGEAMTAEVCVARVAWLR